MARKAHHEAQDKWIIPENGATSFYPRGMKIVWGSDNRYWRLPEDVDPNITPRKPAELLQVSWLEVTSSIEVDKGKKYKVQFELSLKADAFGWNGCPLYIMAKVGKKGTYKYKKVVLSNQDSKERKIYPCGEGEDNELKVEAPPDEDKPRLYFGLYDVWSGKWKGGLEIYRAIVSPVR